MMDKNFECKIVQDLLLGYHDGVLNTESKKLVETHLKTCEKCKEKLASINEELDKEQVKENQIINYIKKYRRKGLIKSIIIAVCIVLFLATTLFLREYVKINEFIAKREKTLQSNNIYSERRSIGNDTNSIFKNYYKDGKQKQVSSLYTGSGEQTSFVTYKSVNSDEELIIHEIDKTYHITKLDKFPDEISLKVLPYSLYNMTSIKERVWILQEFKISKDEKNGKQYWVLTPRDTRANKTEIWINRSTGLVEKEIYYNTIETYFNDSNVIKNLEERINGYTYFYDFDIVTDDDMKEPDHNEEKKNQITEYNKDGVNEADIDFSNLGLIVQNYCEKNEFKVESIKLKSMKNNRAIFEVGFKKNMKLQVANRIIELQKDNGEWKIINE